MNPIRLDPGHPVVAFNQDQITSILRIVADESARASFEMLNSVVQRASMLNLSSNKPTASRARARSSSGPDTDTDISGSVTTYGPRELDSSPGIVSDAESQRDLNQASLYLLPQSSLAWDARTRRLTRDLQLGQAQGAKPWPPSKRRL